MRSKYTPEQWREMWLVARTEDPLVTRQGFADKHEINIANLRKHLSGMDEGDRETLSRYIAARIGECAVELGKQACDIVWHEFKNWEGIHRGSNGTITPHHITAAGGFNAIRAAYFPINATSQQVERKIIQTHALYNRQLGDTLARQQWKTEALEDFAERVFKGRLAPLPAKIGKQHRQKSGKHKGQPRLVNALWSDLHFGSDILADETGGFNYGRAEEARSMGHIVGEIADFKPQYRGDSTLVLWLIGDIIEGHLHPNDAARHAEQMARAIHLLSQSIGHLASAYSQVTVNCASGNHGRIKEVHRERATDGKWNSHETVIYYSLKAILSRFENVRVNIPRTPYVIGSAFGVGTFATHGDTIFNPGYAGKNVPTGNILTQINQMNQDFEDNARERGVAHEPCAVFVCGHTHAPLIHHTTGGRTLIVNGSLPTANGFANSLGRFSSANGQWVWEQVEGFPVGDARFIRVGHAQHIDASLEKIIKPWSAM